MLEFLLSFDHFSYVKLAKTKYKIEIYKPPKKVLDMDQHPALELSMPKSVMNQSLSNQFHVS